MYNPNDPQRKLRRPQPLLTPLERAIDRTRTAPVPAAGPLPNAPVLENPSITERAMSQGAIPTMRELPSQIGPAPNVPMRPRTDAYRPPHLDSMEEHDPIAKAREDYIAPGRDIIGEELAAPRRNWKDTLKTAGLGALQGLATGGIGGAIGGALGGAVMGIASPRAAREYQFETLQRPRMEEDFQRRMMLQKAREEAESRNIQQEYVKTQTGQMQANIERAAEMAPLERAQKAAQTQYYVERAKSLARPPQKETPVRTQILETTNEKGRPVYKAVNLEEMMRTGQTLPAYQRPTARGAGQEKPPATIPSYIFNEYQELNDLKEDAIAAGKLVGQLATPKERENGLTNQQALQDKQENADEALRRYNEKAASLLSAYGEFFEGGTGEGGWMYVQPKQFKDRPRRPR